MGCSQNKDSKSLPNVKRTGVSTKKKSEDENFFKLLVIGDSGVGKSSLLVRFSDGTFSDSFITTIGVDYKVKNLEIDGKPVKLQIWDTAGQERFRTITSSYYRAANGILLVYDITEYETFKGISKWITEINRYASEDLVKILIGNKCDLVSERKVPYETGSELAQQLGIDFYETSAKEKVNVEKSFEKLARKLVGSE